MPTDKSLIDWLRGDEVPQRLDEWRTLDREPTADDIRRTAEADPACEVYPATACLISSIDAIARGALLAGAENMAERYAETHTDLYVNTRGARSLGMAPTTFDVRDETATVSGCVVIRDDAIAHAYSFEQAYDLANIDSVEVDGMGGLLD